MTTSVALTGTYTSLSPSQVQEFSAHVMEAEVFGAFMLAFDTRTAEAGMTQTQLAERLGKDKTGTSKLLSAPRNWTIRTISDLAVALNVVVELSLRDRIEPTRIFTSTGVTYSAVSGDQTPWFSGGRLQVGPLVTGRTYEAANVSLNASAWPAVAFVNQHVVGRGQIGFNSQIVQLRADGSMWDTFS